MHGCHPTNRCARSRPLPARPRRRCRPSLTGCTPTSAGLLSLSERLLKASLLIALYSIRSERAFCEELEYPDKSGLFRRYLGMNLMEPSFDPTVFTKNRQQLFDEVVAEAQERSLLVKYE